MDLTAWIEDYPVVFLKTLQHFCFQAIAVADFNRTQHGFIPCQQNDNPKMQCRCVWKDHLLGRASTGPLTTTTGFCHACTSDMENRTKRELS
ncbi:MAG TPA: hypothetical protein DCZ69_00025 [Syntrophobacteraceae bacterium]|nr:hypothetical protein [Syntrophobacteraceae bacterium]